MPLASQYRRLPKLGAILKNEDSFATSLITILLDKFGLEALSWAPETIRLECKEELHVDLPDLNLDKIMAATDIVTSNKFQTQLPSFIQLCNVLSGLEFDPTVFDPADVFEVSWGITEALLLYPVEDDAEGFSDEIRFYIGHIVREAGIVNPPDVLRIAMYDTAEDPLGAFANDPEMYQAMYELQQSKSDEITGMLKDNLRELFEELGSLPLENGNTEGLLEKIRKSSL
jgi:hypothetical protein